MKTVVKNSKKNAKNKNKKNLFRMAVWCFVAGVFLYTLVTQQINLASIRRETAQCKAEIDAQKEEYSRLKEKAKYNSTDEYYEEKARDKGYVRDNETVFVVGN